MKTICIYHSRDLDGWMSAAIVKKWWLVERKKEHIAQSFNITKKDGIMVDILNTYESEDQLIFLGWDYGDSIPDLSEYDKVIMVDVSFPKNHMESIQYKLGNNFIWIDHHISAINNNKVNLINVEGVNLYEGLRDTEFAACELTWKYFFPNEEMPEIVRLLGRYDCFGHKGTDEEHKVLEFQYGARQCISNYEEAYKYLDLSLRTDTKLYESPEDEILEGGQFIYKYLCTEAKQIYKKAFPIMLKEYTAPEIDTAFIFRKFLCVNQERFNPINFGIDYHKEGYDGFACFWLKDGKWNWSLYNDNGKVDCSAIAKAYDGGGHKGASGFICDNKTMLNIISK